MYAVYHPIYIHIYIWVRGGKQRTPGYTLLDPKLAVESVFEESPEPQKLTVT